MVLDAEMVDQRLHDVIQARIQRKQPGIFRQLAALGGVAVQRQHRRLVAFERFGVLAAE